MQKSDNLYEDIMSQYNAANIKESSDRKFFIDIEAIHELVTGNFVQFTSTELRGSKKKKTGKYSWTYPYDKPVLLNHDQYGGEPVGRVIDAKFSNSTVSGIPAIKLKAEINDPDAIEKIKDKRYQTVSIGAHAKGANCSICNHDWVNEGWCEHTPGGEYEEGTMSLILKDITFVEVSFVNIPADEFATITDFYEESSLIKQSDQSYVFFDKENEPITNTGGLKQDMSEDTIIKLQESIKTKDEHIVTLQEKVDNKEKKIEELSQDLALVQEQKVVLEEKQENLEEEITELTSLNADLKEQHHSHLAKKVVELKLEMGKLKDTKEDDFKEKVIQEHIERSEESLNDTLKDLQLEKEISEYVPEDNKLDKEGLAIKEDKVDNVDEVDEEDYSHLL